MQCSATLKNKSEPTQCKYRAKPGSCFCGVHQKASRVEMFIAGQSHLRARSRTDVPQDGQAPAKRMRIRRKVPEVTEAVSRRALSRVQALVRGFLQRRTNLYRGPALFNRTLLHNTNDFMTFEDCRTIPCERFFSFRDSDNFVYGFRLTSIVELLKYSSQNPYTRTPFPVAVRERLERLQIQRRAVDSKDSQTAADSVSAKHLGKRRCVEVFQLLDDLELYTEVCWFLGLSLYNLHRLYYDMMDIWKRRARLSAARKKLFANEGQHGTLFKHTGYSILKIVDKLQMQLCILDVVQRLATEGTTKDNCITASYWFLTALVMVSPEAALGYPHLVSN